jgi:lipoyl-dependent peroxiredoxin
MRFMSGEVSFLEQSLARSYFRTQGKTMTDIKRIGQAYWSGELLKGAGKTSTGSGVLRDVPYSVPSRFQSEKGTNPEELLAAAHASCFSMMLAKVLGDQKITVKSIDTKATLTLGQRGGGWKITTIDLETEVSGDGLDDAKLKSAADIAKEQCPVSVLLKPGLESITLAARLKS